MREFETTYVLQPEIGDEGLGALQERLDGIFDRAGAVRLLYDDDGKRRLAYEIRRFQKGHYVTVHYLDEGAVVPEIERVLRLDESVLRFLTVRVADRVEDVETRKQAAKEEEAVRAERAAERAAREAEDRARAEEEAREAAARAAAEAAEAAKAAEQAGAESEADDEESEAGEGGEAGKAGKAADAADAPEGEEE